MSEKIIIKLDASALVQSACGLRMKLSLIDGVSDGIPYNDTLFGSAFHTFASTVTETSGDLQKATIAAKKIFSLPCRVRDNKKYMDELMLIKTSLDWFTQLGTKDDFEVLLNEQGKPCVEIYFEHKVHEDEYCIIYLCGTIDRIGKFKNGCYAISDYKTHSLYSAAKFGIPEFFKKFELSTQMMFYIHNTYLMGKLAPNSIIGNMCKTPIGYFIEGVFFQGKDKPVIFERSEVHIPPQNKLDEFEHLLNKEIKKLITLAFDSRYNPQFIRREGMINGACVDGKYTCKFWQLCAAYDDKMRAALLAKNFTVKPYDPSKHGRE